MARPTISQRIALEGGDQIKKALAELGKAGEDAFAQLQKAGEKVNLSGPVGIAPFSARGLTQTLEPIDASAQLKRTVNGALVDMSYEPFRKYKSTISCQDQEPPAIDGVWPGLVVQVGCVAELSFPTAGSGPARPAVDASSRTEGAFTFYRPILSMRVTGFSVSCDEYGSAVSWQLHLEEV